LLPEGSDAAQDENGPLAHFLFFEQMVRWESLTRDEVKALLEPTIEGLGYELADLEVRLGGKHGLLRVFIDSADGIGLDDCEKVSLAVSAILDVEDPLPGHYDLEVSSPGLDRKLTKVEHFQRYEGETVKVQMRFPVEGRRRFRGTLVSSDEENIVVDVDGIEHTLPVANIDTARLVPGDI
jgi:ribosome maturation factor RimP